MELDLRDVTVYYLNRAGDDVRHSHMQTVGKQFGFKKFHRVEGPVDPKRFMAGSTGMCRIAELALCKEPFQPFIILEDDCNLTPYYPWNEETSYKLVVPEDADIVYLGISRWGVHPTHPVCTHNLKFRTYNARLKQVYNMLSLHAILFCSRCFTRNFMRNMVEAAITNTTWDTFVARSQSCFKCYALTRPLFYQDKTVRGDEIPTLITLEDRQDTVSAKEAIDFELGKRYAADNLPISTSLLLDNPRKLSIEYFRIPLSTGTHSENGTAAGTHSEDGTAVGTHSEDGTSAGPSSRLKVAVKIQGGLGNQLFQIAVLLAYAREHDFYPIFDPRFVGELHTGKVFWHQYPELQRVIPKDTLTEEYEVYTENEHVFNKIPKANKDLLIDGYYNSDRYFESTKDEIIKLFQDIFKIGELRDELALHIRRGNALGKIHLNVHRLLDIKYYREAIFYYKSTNLVILYEDEESVEWGRKELAPLFHNKQVTWQSADLISDFRRMANARDGIIVVNSTFSWWAAYLNPSPTKKVTFPKTWFASQGPKYWGRYEVKGWIPVHEVNNIYLIHKADGEDKEGIGAIAQCQLQCLAASQILGVNYFHTPFTRIYHYQPYNTDPEIWDQEWNDYFGLQRYHSPINGVYREVNLTDSPADLEKFVAEHHYDGNTYLVRMNRMLLINFCDQYVDRIVALLSEIGGPVKTMTPNNYFDETRFNVAIHLRKYTATDCDPSSNRKLYDGSQIPFFERLMQTIESVCNHQIDFHIYSQGQESEFKLLLKLKLNPTTRVILHIGEHPRLSFYHMAVADLLVMSNSSFSYIAHFFSKGILIQRSNFWHKLRKNTIYFDDNGLNPDQLKKQYDRLQLVNRLNLGTLYDPISNKLKLPKGSKIKLDVGLSYSAPNSALWLKNLPNRVVFGFEPNRECIHHIINGLGYPVEPNSLKVNPKDHKNNFYLLPCALDDTDPSSKIFYSTDGDLGCSSLYEPNPERLKIKESYQVYCIGLATFFELFDWDQIPYIEHIKIDAQGNDLRILHSAKEYLSRIVFITIECADEIQFYKCNESYSGHTLQQLLSLMEKYEFSPYASDICDPFTGNKKISSHQSGGNYTYVNNRFKSLISSDRLDASHLGL